MPEHTPTMPTSRVLGRVAAALVLALLAGCGVASAARAGSRTTHLNVRWHLVGHDAVATNGRVSALPSITADGRRLTGLQVIDEQRRVAGRTTPLPRWCRTPRGSAFGHGGVVLRCDPARLALFSLEHRRWLSLPVRGACRRSLANCDLQDVGRRWISYYVSGSGGGDFVENIATRTVRLAPPRNRFIVDLDSPTVGRRPCPAVRLPLNGHLEARGRAVLVSENEGDTTLYHCGSHRHELLSEDGLPSLFGPGVVAYSAKGSVGVITLDGRRRFVIPPPQRRLPVFVATWTVGHVYAMTLGRQRGDIRVWSAEAPSLPGATAPAPRSSRRASAVATRP